jgi:hypothetical protein
MLRHEGEQEQKTSCGDVFCVTLYYLALFIINICPVIGWIIGLYRLCNSEKYLSHPDAHERKMAHFWLFLNGTIVFYVLFYLIYYVAKYWWRALQKGFELKYEKPERTLEDRFIGGCLLTVFTCGLFLIYYFFELWWRLGAWGYDMYYKSTDDEGQPVSVCVRVTGFVILSVTTLFLFMIYKFFQGWKILFCWSAMVIYDERDSSCCRSFGAYLALLLTTLFTYLVWLVFEYWIRGLVACYDYSHPHDNQGLTCSKFWGHMGLGVLSFGLYFIGKFIELWVRLFLYGRELAYMKENRTEDDIFFGRIYLTISTCCIYLIYWAGITLYAGVHQAYMLWWNFCKVSWALAYGSGRTNSEKLCGKSQLVLATIGLYLIVLFFEYWIRLGILGFELRYTRLDRTGCKIFWGYVILIITTLFIYLPIHLIELWVRLIILGAYLSYDKIGRTSKDILCGYFCLGLASFGIFWVYKIVEILVRVEIEIIRASYHLTYDKHEHYSKLKQIAGRLLYTIFTCGLFIVFMLVEFIYRMVVNLREPPFSTEYHMGIFQASMLTGGLVWIWWLTTSLNMWVRRGSKLSAIVINGVMVGCLYYYCILDQVKQGSYLLIPLCLISYPTYLIIMYFSYTESIRTFATLVARFFILGYWKICHGCDHIAQVFRKMHVRGSNYRSAKWAQFATWNSARHAYLFNVRWRRVFGNPIRVPGDPNYITSVVYQSIVQLLPEFRSWETKLHERVYSEQALKARKVTNTIFTIDCIIAKLKVNFAQKQLTQPSTSDLFWAQRFDQLTDLPVYRDYKAKDLKEVIYVMTYQNHEIRPDLEGSNQDYKVTQQFFEIYLDELSQLKSHTLEGYSYHIDQYLAKINNHANPIQVEIPIPVQPPLLIERQPADFQQAIEGRQQNIEGRPAHEEDHVVQIQDAEAEKEPGLPFSYQNDENI